MKKSGLPLLLILLLNTFGALAQGNLSGNLQLNMNFFQGDSAIAFTPGNEQFYKKYLSGGEGWLSLRYNYKGFTAFVRLDAYHNSNLYNPQEALTNYGIGAYSLSKEIGQLTITGGHIYDQIGSGILFRAYEDRGLLIDNALVGLHVKYRPADNITIKGMTGQQKNIATLGRYEPIIKALNAEGDFNLGEQVHVSPGIGVLNRTLDPSSINTIASSINNQPLETRFVPKYNMYAFTAYNTLSVGSVSWYLEGAYKTHEAIVKDNLLQDKPGNVVYTTLGYARKGLAVNVSAKRTENFVMRTSPNEILIRGVINWQPVVARLRPQRLMARYTPPSQDLSELAAGADVLISPNDNLDLTLNYTHINTLNDVALYREFFGEFEYRGWEKWTWIGGVQVMEYNQELYQQKPVKENVKSFIPFLEGTYRFTEKKSLRFEVEYQHTKQDYGSWAFALIEYNIAPRWSFSISDMYNVDPNPEVVEGPGKHYYSFFTAYTKDAHRFTLAWVRQVEGINCTGGVCRYEPAFSGVRLGITSSF